MKFTSNIPGMTATLRVQGPRAPQPAKRGRKTFKAFVSAEVVSEANRREHWGAKHRRAKEQKLAVARAFGFELQGRGKPKRVKFVLLTSQAQDDDNLRRSLKSYRDQVAVMCGFNDREEVWRYGQETLRSFEQRGVWIVVEF